MTLQTIFTVNKRIFPKIFHPQYVALNQHAEKRTRRSETRENGHRKQKHGWNAAFHFLQEVFTMTLIVLKLSSRCCV